MFNNSKKIIQIILFLWWIPAHCLPRKLWWDLGHVKVTLNISIFTKNRCVGIDLGPRGLSDTPGHVCRGPSDALGRVRPKGRASWEVPGAIEKYKNKCFMFFERQMFLFFTFLRIDLAHFGGPQRSLAALGGPPGSFWERVFGPWELSGVSLWKRAWHWRVQRRGPGHRIRRPQGKVHDGKVHNNTHIPVVFWWFWKTTCFWKGGLHGR